MAEQMNIFDFMYEEYKLPSDRPIRIIETFAGIGTQKMAFDKLGVDVDVIAIVEVDKFAMLTYASIHTNYLDIRDYYFNDKEITKEEMVDHLQERNIGINFSTMKHSITMRNNIEIVRDYYLACILTNNLGDISKVKGSDLPKQIDMLTYSFPCTDLSKAGNQKGLENTRSGLVYEVFRIIEELKELDNQPVTLIMENVIDLIQAKFVKEFNEMQLDLEKLGYQNYNFVMNAKDFGVAQNRERIFMVSLPLKSNYREPIPIKLEKRLKDYLEEEVEEKYYLSDKFIKGMTSENTGKYARKERFEGSVKEINQWEYSTTITTREGNVATSTFLKIKEATKKGYDEAFEGDSITLDQPNSETRRGRVGKSIVNTLTTSCNNGVVVSKKNELCNKMISNGHLKESDMIRHSYTNERMENIERTESSNGISATLTTRPDTLGVVVSNKPICLNSKVDGKQPSLQDRVYSDNGTMPAITTGFHPSVATDDVSGTYIGTSEAFTREPTKGIARTLLTKGNGAIQYPNLRIRKLTPKECWRLMGIDDSYFDKAVQVTSNAQLYKQAGNAIVVDVFAKIIERLIERVDNN